MPTIHETAVKSCLLWATIADKRISRIPAAIRRTRRDGCLSKKVAEAVSPCTHGGLDFRRDTGCSSGRSLFWFTPQYMRASAMIRDLVAEGYHVSDARRIAKNAALCEQCVWAVADSPPPSVSDAEVMASKYYKHMKCWAARKAVELGVSINHVWRWQAWRERARKPAQIGRRTRQWFSLSGQLSE